MIDFTRANLTHLVIHHVGNKGLGEEITLRNEWFEFKDDFVKETLLRYLQTPFKTDVYYKFLHKNEFAFRNVQSLAGEIFKSRKDIIQHSHDLAKLLYDQTLHPKLKGGEFYVAYFKDVMVDGELVDAVGLFKTETKETFLKVYDQGGSVDVDCEAGINITKLDKGCLIYNTDAEKGYKLSIVDSNKKVAECSAYWQYDFLAAQLKENAYYHTSNFIDTCRAFCEEVLIEDNNVTKDQSAALKNTSVEFVSLRDKINVKEFEKEVLEDDALIKSFRDYRKDYAERLDLKVIDEFDVSQTAVKANKKHMRSVIKLDKNFHVYIHGRTDHMERGFDEEKGMKYIKLFYVNEE